MSHYILSMFLLGILWKWESESKLTCGQVWWHILGICALHLTHPSAHTLVNTDTHTHTHTHRHTPPEQWAAILLWRPGSSWGFGALLNGLTSVMVLRVERERCTFTPPTYNPCQYWDSNPWPSGHKSDSLSIRPQLPNWLGSFGEYQPWNKIKLYVTRVGYRSHLNRYQYRYRYLEFGTSTQRYLFSVLYSLCNNKNIYFSEKISPKLSISTFWTIGPYNFFYFFSSRNFCFIFF